MKKRIKLSEQDVNRFLADSGVSACFVKEGSDLTSVRFTNADGAIFEINKPGTYADCIEAHAESDKERKKLHIISGMVRNIKISEEFEEKADADSWIRDLELNLGLTAQESESILCEEKEMLVPIEDTHKVTDEFQIPF